MAALIEKVGDMKMRNGVITILLSLMWVPAQAETYKVGVEDIDYYPVYTTRDGQYSGFAKDLLDMFAEAQGHKFEYKAYPIARLIGTFVEGQVDFKFPDNPNWAGDAKKGKTVHYSEPAQPYTDGTLVLPKHKGKGLDALGKLGIVRGFTPWDYLGSIEQGKVQLNEVSNVEAMMNLGLSERVGGVYFNVDVARHVLAEQLKKPGGLEFDDTLPHTKSQYHLSTIKHPELIEQFNVWLAANADKVEKLRKQYGLN